MQVLVADDSPTMRHQLRAHLEGWGYTVLIARDGNQAWEMLQRDDAPCIAILDWVMPSLTGPELCRRLRAQKRERYVYTILLTAKNEQADIVEGLGAGADDYVVKPFNQHELEVRLRAGRRIIDLQAELMHAREALREQATKDSLTKCWNRSSILEILGREMARAERERRHLGIIMADLDFFKRVNDTYGHAAGDQVLYEVVQRMQACIRPYDSLGRLGGEEFLIILPGCDEPCLMNHAERLRQAVAALPIEAGAHSLLLTSSFGASAAPAGLAITPNLLMIAADEALYAAKHGGRNCVAYSHCSPGKPVGV